MYKTMTTQTFKTMCPMNCHPTLCGMKVQVRDQQLVSIEGDEENPDSQGVLCVRGNSCLLYTSDAADE